MRPTGEPQASTAIFLICDRIRFGGYLVGLCSFPISGSYKH